MRLGSGDLVQGVCNVSDKLLVAVSEQGYSVAFAKKDLPLLRNGGKGVILQKMTGGDSLTALASVSRKDKIKVAVAKGKPRDILVSEVKQNSRAKRGLKMVKRGTPVLGIIAQKQKGAAKNLSLDF